MMMAFDRYRGSGGGGGSADISSRHRNGGAWTGAATRTTSKRRSRCVTNISNHNFDADEHDDPKVHSASVPRRKSLTMQQQQQQPQSFLLPLTDSGSSTPRRISSLKPPASLSSGTRGTTTTPPPSPRTWSTPNTNMRRHHHRFLPESSGRKGGCVKRSKLLPCCTRITWSHYAMLATLVGLRFAYQVLWLHQQHDASLNMLLLQDKISAAKNDYWKSSGSNSPHHHHHHQRPVPSTPTSANGSSGGGVSFSPAKPGSPTKTTTAVVATTTTVRARSIATRPYQPDIVMVWNESRHRERRQRLQPSSTAFTTDKTIPSLPLLLATTPLALPPTHNNTNNHTYSWPDLCRQANVLPHSRVVITNIISQPAATAWALLLHRQCHVTIVGVDALVPNTRWQRATWMGTYQMLQQSISSLQLVVPPYATVMMKQHDNIPGGLQQASHVFVFENTVDNNTMMLEHMTPSNAWLYQRATRYQMMNDLLVAAAATARAASKHDFRRHMVIVSPTPLTEAQRAAAAHHDVTHLQLPYRLFGPLLPQLGKEGKTALSLLHVDDAMAAIFAALAATTTAMMPRDNRTHGSAAVRYYTLRDDSAAQVTVTPLQVSNHVHAAQRRLRLQHIRQRNVTVAADMITSTDSRPDNTTADQRWLQLLTWKASQAAPYGDPDHDKLESRFHADYMDTYGVHQVALPCAANCASPVTPCQPSTVWTPKLLAVTTNATHGCKLVVYTLQLDANLRSVHHVDASENYLCRVVFVAKSSPLVQERIRSMVAGKKNVQIANTTEADLEAFNGQVRSHGWKIVWLTKDADTISDIDLALPRIDPGLMFADHVNKATYLEGEDFASAPDRVLLRILLAVDRPSRPKRNRLERRPGTEARRYVPVPAERRRDVVLLGGEPNEGGALPASAAEYAQQRRKMSKTNIPSRQVAFYDRAAHFMQQNMMRPLTETRTTLYNAFPWTWLSRNMLVHDLRQSAGRELRCEWMHEYVSWSALALPGESSRNTEPLSLAYLLARRKIMGTLGPTTDEAASPGWWPVMVPTQSTNSMQPLINLRDAQVFLRIMTRQFDSEEIDAAAADEATEDETP